MVYHLHEKNPLFQEWDGYRNKLLLLLQHVDYIRQTKQITDAAAVRYALWMMVVGDYGNFDGKGPLTRQDFVDVLNTRFMPDDIVSLLLT